MGAAPLLSMGRAAGPAVRQPADGAARPAPILFVHSGQNWIRGSEQCLLDLVAHVDRRRFAPVVCCDSPALAQAAAALGVPVHQVPGWQVAATRWLPSRDEVATMRHVVGEHQIRLIHTNDTEPIKALLPVARAKRLPIVAHLHITIDEAERRWSFLHQVALAVGVSEAAVAGLRADGFPESRIAVVHNGIDPERLDRGDARDLRRAHGIAETDVVFTALGSLIHRKGVDVVLDAFERLAARHPHCHLLVCGAGPDRETLEARAGRLDCARRVHFLGERRDAGAILRDATDVLVSGSREEAFPLNVLEAGYFGVPIVATNIPPHLEFAGESPAGLLVPPDDPAGLAGAMARLAADAADRRARGHEARRRVRELFLVSQMVRRFETIYASLLDEPPRAFGWMKGSTWPPSYTRWAAASIMRMTARRAPAPARA